MVDHIKLQKLAEMVIRLAGKEEFLDKYKVDIYSETLDQSQYPEHTINSMSRGVGSMTAYGKGEPVLTLNADKEKEVFENCNAESACSKKYNYTCAYVYVVLHELGHWVANCKLESIVEQYPGVEFKEQVDIAPVFLNTNLEYEIFRFLDFDEHHADYFAILHFNYVLDKLEEIDPNLLTYLD